MSAPIDGLPRRVIPRWRDFTTAAALGELSPPIPPTSVIDIPDGLRGISNLWKSRQTETIAGELLSAAWLQGSRDQAAEAARFLLRKESTAQPLTKDFAQMVLTELDSSTSGQPSADSMAVLNRNAVRSIRAALRLYPNDALGWCELARYYTIIGKREKARRCIMVAINLAPNSRYILRSAARCLIHLDELDTALGVLVRSPRTRVDPWLLAAQVAVGNILEKPPRFYKQAKDLIRSASISPFHVAELNAALATVEMSTGNDKPARKMFTAALADPTENVTAQAWWAKRRLGMPIDPGLLSLPRSFEANTRALVLTEKWRTAATAAEQWLDDEPFSSTPAIELSFILSVGFEEHDRAEAILRRAHVASPDDLLVLNNLSFALAHLGKLEEAASLLSKANVEDAKPGTLVAITATGGLLNMRNGNIVEGRRLYQAAIELALKHQLERHAALATVFLAKEEKRAMTEFSQLAVAEAERLATKYKDPGFRLVLRTLREGPLPHVDEDTELSAQVKSKLEQSRSEIATGSYITRRVE